MSRIFVGIESLHEGVGNNLGWSSWVTLMQQDVDDFARLTGDHNWLHTDQVAAAAGPFGGTIVHGYLTLCLTPRLLLDLLAVSEVGTPVNYGCNRVRFPSVLPVGQPVRMSGVIATVDEVPGGTQLVIDITYEVEGSSKPVCVAAVVIHYVR